MKWSLCHDEWHEYHCAAGHPRPVGRAIGARRRRRFRDHDRRARQGGWRAALSRRRHRGPRRRGALREGLGPAGRRPASTRACRRPNRIRCMRPLRRSARRRPERAGDARARVGLPPADRHLRRGGPREPRARIGHGAVVRRAVRARRRPAAGAAVGGRQGPIDPRALPDPLARRGEPRPRQGDRRLLDLRGRARHERLDVHRARGRLDRRRRRRRAQRRGRRPERPAARRRAQPRAEDARRGRATSATPSAGSRTRSTAASA